jgi:hypothetical protein
MVQLLDKYGNSSIDNANVVILDKNGKVKNLNYTGGTVTSIITASPITGGPITTTGTIGITQATTSTDGYLSSTDWNTFNSKFNLPTLTSGSVLFSNGTTITQNNAQFFWDNTNNRLGIGKTNPGVKLDVNGDIRTNGILFGTTAQINNIQTNGANLLIKGVTATLVTVDQTSGNVGIGMTPTAKLTIKAPGALSTDIALRVRNSADSADLMSIAGDGSNKFNGTTITPVKISSTAGASLINFSDSAGAGTYIGSNNNSLWLYTNDLVRLVISNTGNVLIGTTTNIPSSKLTVESTTQGFLPPRMTTTQKNAIATPVSGLVVYDTTLGKLCVRGASAWETITSI